MSINEYERILKENIEPVLLPFAQKLLGLERAKFSSIKDDIHVTIERKPDFLKRVKEDNDSNSYILQIEFQSVDDSEMVYRMLEYRAILLRKYHTEIRQVVLYIGQAPLRKMTKSLSMNNLSFAYEMIDIRSFDYELFINSRILEEVLLAILSNFNQTPPRKVINSILDKLQELLKGNNRFGKYLKQLEVLAKLRNLQDETVKQTAIMPIVYDLETDIRYVQGMTMGEEKGKEKTLDNNIILLLQSNLLTAQQIADTLNVPLKRVEKLKKKL